MAASTMEGAVRVAGALVGGGLALGGGAIGAAVGDGLAGSQTIDLTFTYGGTIYTGTATITFS